MGIETKIEWTHHTFNPWWGCTKVSPGCTNCYAEAWSKFTGNNVWGNEAPRRFFGEAHWAEPLKWDREAREAGERRRVFCASMADVFEDRPDLIEPRARVFALIEATPNLDWLLLTKRPQNVPMLAPVRWGADPDRALFDDTTLMPPNVWVGTTVEDQQRANERIPALLNVPAVVRFLSVEPLLEAVNITRLSESKGLASPGLDGLQWVIVGGESGAGSRPFGIEWARSVVRQCAAARVPCFVKQLGKRPEAVMEITTLVEKGTAAIPLHLKDKKGGDWSEWPADLRVREYPTTRAPAPTQGRG